jgi:hypothetical protein
MSGTPRPTRSREKKYSSRGSVAASILRAPGGDAPELGVDEGELVCADVRGAVGHAVVGPGVVADGAGAGVVGAAGLAARGEGLG